MWRIKAGVQRVCATIPLGDHLYRMVQSTVGGLRSHRPDSYVEACQRTLAALGGPEALRDASTVEIGTGWNVNLPLALHLHGVQSCATYDASRYCRPRFARRAAHALVPALRAASDPAMANLVDQRWERLEGLAWDELLAAAGITYRAPADAAKTGLTSSSQNLVFSRAVLQHIEPSALRNIFREAERVLKPGGYMWHSLGLTDQRRLFDKRLSPIEYLRHSPDEWAKLAGNRYAYSNRWRLSQFVRLAEESGFSVEVGNVVVDPGSISFVRSGALHEDFAGWDEEDLATVSADLVARKP